MKGIVSVLLCIIAMTGLYFHVEYAGWILFLAFLVVL